MSTTSDHYCTDVYIDKIMLQDRYASRDVNRTIQMNLRYIKHVYIRRNILQVWLNALGKLVIMNSICNLSKALRCWEDGSQQIRHTI